MSSADCKSFVKKGQKGKRGRRRRWKSDEK